MKTEDFIKKARKVHGNFYDYSNVDYCGSRNKVEIICPIHGSFSQEPAAHLRGYGCPMCANKKRGDTFRGTLEDFIKKAREVHGDKYDYSEVDYKNYSTKVRIKCPLHGVFEQTPTAHVLAKHGCPMCNGRNLTTKDIIEKFVSVHGDEYDYSRVDYKKMHEKVDIICKEHGLFRQTPSKHILGQGCPKCAAIKRGKLKNQSNEEFIDKCKMTFGDMYDYSNTKYISPTERVEIICKKHGPFLQRPYDHLLGHGCPKCGNILSKGESEIYEYICSLLGKDNVVRGDRTVLDGKEIDIYIPSLKVGFEYDGLKWHSDEFGRGNRYHLEKTNECLKKGVELYHIFEDEYTEKKKIVLSKIRHIVQKDNSTKVMGRKCEVKEISKNVAKTFINEYHIQGYSSGSIFIGAYFGGELIAVMTFMKYGNGKYILNRFASNDRYICQGVCGKIFSYFKKKYKPEIVESFADRRWTIKPTENLYTKIGFDMVDVLRPEYRYVNSSKPNRRIHKFNFRKEILSKRYGLPKDMTESEMVKKLGYYKVFDCGLYKYVYIAKSDTHE